MIKQTHNQCIMSLQTFGTSSALVWCMAWLQTIYRTLRKKNCWMTTLCLLFFWGGGGKGVKGPRDPQKSPMGRHSIVLDCIRACGYISGLHTEIFTNAGIW